MYIMVLLHCDRELLRYTILTYIHSKAHKRSVQYVPMSKYHFWCYQDFHSVTFVTFCNALIYCNANPNSKNTAEFIKESKISIFHTSLFGCIILRLSRINKRSMGDQEFFYITKFHCIRNTQPTQFCILNLLFSCLPELY